MLVLTRRYGGLVEGLNVLLDDDRLGSWVLDWGGVLLSFELYEAKSKDDE